MSSAGGTSTRRRSIAPWSGRTSRSREPALARASPPSVLREEASTGGLLAETRFERLVGAMELFDRALAVASREVLTRGAKMCRVRGTGSRDRLGTGACRRERDDEEERERDACHETRCHERPR